MENASKALIIAGAILLSILIIGLGMYIYQQAADVMGNTGLTSQEVQAYNSKFLNYEGQQTGSSVRALCDVIRNHNNTDAADDTSLQIGIWYENGNLGVKKDEDNIDDEVSYDEVSKVKSAIKSGKTYNVEFKVAKSGKIVYAIISDKKSSSGSNQ